MDLRDLNMFLLVSQTLHFGRASKELHISASGLTRAVQRLEQELGVPLLERDRRSVRLTIAGAKVRDFASDTLEQLRTLQHELHDHTHLRGRLSLFCSVTASYSFLHDLLQQFRSRYPHIELQIHTGDSAQAIARVAEERDDLAIAALPDRLPENIAFLALGTSPLVCIGPLAECPVTEQIHLACAGQDYDWQALPMILPESGLARMRIEQWFRARGVVPRVYAQVSGHEAMVSMVSLGCGLAVVPRIVIENSPLRERIQILPLMTELEPFTIGLCALKRRFANPLVSALWSVAPEMTGHLGRSGDEHV